jgi:excisionase family DNA binding protein
MKNQILNFLHEQEERLERIEGHLSMSKTVLNLEELCKLTGLSKSHIYKRTMASTIPHYKQSKHLYFDRLEIEDWLKANRIKTADEIDKEAATYVALGKSGGAR